MEVPTVRDDWWGGEGVIGGGMLVLGFWSFGGKLRKEDVMQNQ